MVRKKLAYLGRLEIPDVFNGKNEALTDNRGWMRCYHNLRNDKRRVLRGTKKPDAKIAWLYCTVVNRIVPDNRKDEKAVARAAAGMQECIKCSAQNIKDKMR